MAVWAAAVRRGNSADSRASKATARPFASPTTTTTTTTTAAMGTTPLVSAADGAAVQAACASVLGGRPKQQDDMLVALDLFCHTDGRPVHLFAVFDGHGSDGHKAATATKKLFTSSIIYAKNEILNDTAQTFKDIYNKVHQELLEDSSIDLYMSGTTAVVALLHGDTVHVSHVGDSRLVVISQECDTSTALQALQVTQDHTCDLDPEHERVKATGARIEQLKTGDEFEGPLRIFKGTLPYPGIVVTRSIGDSVATKLGVIHEPEVKTIQLSQQDKYLLLATDGLWDAVSPKQAADVIEKYTDVQAAVDELTKVGLQALQDLKLDDNMTTILVKLPRN